MIFFKIVCCFANSAQGKFYNLRILGSGEAIYHFEMIFSRLNTYHLQTLSREIRKVPRNILDLGAVSWSSTFHPPCRVEGNDN